MGSISTLNAFSKVRFLPLAHCKVDRTCRKKSKFEKLDKLQGQKRITCKEGRRQFFFTLPKYYPRSVKCEGWWTLWRRVWGPQSPEMGSRCQFWKFQTPISPLIGGRFLRNKDHFSQGPQGSNTQGSNRRYVPRKGVKGQSAPNSKFRGFLHFSQNFWNKFLIFFHMLYYYPRSDRWTL